MRTAIVFWAFALAGTTSACGGSCPASPTNLPQPLLNTAVGPGDVFEVFVLNEQNLPKEYRVQPDGTIDFPYIPRLIVAGLEPQAIVDKIKQELQSAKILSAPQISLVVKQYNSKKVNVLGQVAKPGPLNYSDGMKLVDAISQSGGFSPLADSRHVRLTRLTSGTGKNAAQAKAGETVTVEICVDAIINEGRPDIMLQSGDTIKVEQRIF
jgi:protein involved in polysaccharide export with SLBB domain